MKTLSDYSLSKEKALNRLKTFESEYIAVLDNNSEIENIDFIKNKISNIRQQIEKDEIIIAVFGSFSDGKSTIIKAITGVEDIEISPAPTTDKVNTYISEDKSYIIVDTPGLFSENDIHSEITKKYISEANLILYVTEAVNPLKESHHNTVKWILNDLNKLESTVFLINKMDSVADLEDEDEFLEQSQIKIKNVYETVYIINPDIKKENILPIAADPYQKGLDFWNQRKDIYLELSKINKIHEKLSPILEERKDKLLENMVDSVIRDCKEHLINELSALLKIKRELIELEQSSLDYTKDNFLNLEKDIDLKYKNISERFEQLRQEYTNKIISLSDQKDFIDYYDLMLGEDYYLLNERVENIIRDETEILLERQIDMVDDLNNNAKKYEEQKYRVLERGTIFSSALSNSIKVIPSSRIKEGIKIFRDTAKLPIKFKPWGMAKLAEKIKIGGNVLGIGITFVESLTAYTKQKEWEDFISDHRQKVASYFKEIKKNFTYKEYLHTYFPSVEAYKNDIKEKENLVRKTNEENEWLNGYIEKLKKMV